MCYFPFDVHHMSIFFVLRDRTAQYHLVRDRSKKTHESRFQTPADDEHTLTSNKHSRCFETDSIVSVKRKGPSRCPPPHATQKRVREDCDFRHRLKNFEENSFAWRVETDTRRFLRVGFYCRIGNGTNAKMLDKVYNKKGARNRK